jgi:hypothetical protein
MIPGEHNSQQEEVKQNEVSRTQSFNAGLPVEGSKVGSLCLEASASSPCSAFLLAPFLPASASLARYSREGRAPPASP